MIKETITNFFSSKEKWIKNREKTFFKTLEEVEIYQEHRVKFLENYYKINIKNTKTTNAIPNVKSGFKNFIKMNRSGTTSNNNERTFYYSLPEQSIMDTHHFWKIEKSHNLTMPGDIFWICATDYNIPDDSGKILGNPKKARIFGPKKYFNVGEENDTYEFLYSSRFTKEHWRYNLDLISKRKNIKFIRTSPSVIQTMFYFFKDAYKFNCPVILSEETLQEDVRKIAEGMFEKVIDKCVSWDGCLAWFECPYKTKHIYDEFCIVKETKNKILSVTDLQNLACPFVNYINGDMGSLGKKVCKCGIAGNYLKEFEGKIIESIYINDEKYLPGRYIHEKLSQFFRIQEYDFSKDNAFKEITFEETKNEIKFPDKIIYKIKQREDLEIDFFYECEDCLNNLQQKKIEQFLKVIIWQNKNCKKINFIKINNINSKDHKRQKSLSIESDYVRNIIKNKL